MLNNLSIWFLRWRIGKFDGADMLDLLRLLAVSLQGNIVVEGYFSKMTVPKPKPPMKTGVHGEAEKASWN